MADITYSVDAPNGKIHHLNPDGTIHHSFPAPFQVGGLANDGVNLLAASLYSNQLIKLNPANGNIAGGPYNLNVPGQYYGIGSAQALGFYAPNNLLWASYNQIWRIDMTGQTPTVQNADNLNPQINVSGLAVKDSDGTVYMGGYDPNVYPQVQKVFKSLHPSAPPQEKTTAGSYTAKLTVTSNPTTYTHTPLNFKLKAHTQSDPVAITITTPATGSAVQSTSVSLTGTTNDPTMTSVTVGTGLLTAAFFEDKVETVVVPSTTPATQTTDIWQPSALNNNVGWHVTEDRSLQLGSANATIKQGGQKSWAYNKPAQPQYFMPPNYDSGGTTNSGFLETKQGYEVKGESKLRFWTAWNTEPIPSYDLKLIQANTGTGWVTVAKITEAFGMGPKFFMPGPGGMMPWGMDTSPVEVNAASGSNNVAVPQFTWKEVKLDFGNRFKDKTVKLRFRFDTVDGYANFLEGWYIDNVEFKGVGLAGGASVAVANLAFSTTVTIGEGETTINVSGTSGYSAALGSPESLSATASTTVSLDITFPVVTINAVTSPTSSASQTVTGTVVEANLKAQTSDPATSGIGMTQTSSAGTKPLLPTVSGSGSTKTFSMEVNLNAGENTIQVKATDKADQATTASATIIYDVIPPTISALTTLYPVGEVSARTGDFFLYQVEATDFGSSVKAVQLLTSANPTVIAGLSGANLTNYNTVTSGLGQEVTVGDNTYQKITSANTLGITSGDYDLMPFIKSSQVPQAIRSQWGQSAPTLANGTGVATGAPKVLSSTVSPTSTSSTVTNTVAVTTAGNFTIALPSGVAGTVSGTIVSGTPVTLTAGTSNTITTTATGSFTVSITDNRWLKPMELPSGAPPGTYTLFARAKDQGDNASATTVNASVVSTLSKFNIYLLPSWNLIGTPLIPTSTAIATVLAGMADSGLQAVWYYNTATNAWVSYGPGVGGDLTSFETGRGYWAYMNPTTFASDEPLATGLPDTPRPVKLTISGSVLQPGNQPPPTYSIKAGWNLIALHAEKDTPVSTGLGSLTSPFGARLWGSMLEYKNFIKYPTKKGESPETVLGAFSSVGTGGTMNPGKGYWLFAMADGSIVP